MPKRTDLSSILIIGAVGIVSLFLAIAPSLAQAKTYQCPDHVTMKSNLGGLTSGWQQRGPYGVPPDAVPTSVTNVGLFSGDPKEGASLVPDNDDAPDADKHSIWTFVADDPYTPWLACYYDKTPVAAALELPKGTRRCEVTYKPRGNRSDVERITCE